MEDLVTIRVDGQEMQVPKGTLLWEACKAHGIDIPVFCYHTKLGPVGACRTCLVEVEGNTKGPITACSTPVAEGMAVRTRSPMAQKAQRGIFEFLLLNHPLDCPICDRGGECPLQDQTFAYGPGTSRYVEPKRHHVKPIALGPTIALDRERCVLCWRCVRFCAEVAEDKSIVLLDRGDHTVVGTFQDEPYVSNFSGNVIELCPVGALTSRKQRFNFRPWELSNRPSVCPHCPMGCNINISVRKNDEVIRFLSRDNPEVDDSWLCDRGRFNFEFINNPERLTLPLVRQREGFVQTSWEEALRLTADRLQEISRTNGASSVAGIASPRLTSEELFIFKRFMSDVVGSPNVDHFPRAEAPGLPGLRETAERLRAATARITDLDRAQTIVLLGADPSRREPVMELRIRLAVNRHGAKLVVINPDEIPLSSRAHVTLRCETQSFASFTRGLADSVRAARSGASGAGEIERVAGQYLAGGHTVLMYDDSFEGIVDKGDALGAVLQLAEALGAPDGAGVIPLLDDCNSMGARDLGLYPSEARGLASTVETLLGPNSPIRAALVFGPNLARELAARDMTARLRGLEFLVVSELVATETARVADVIFPAASFAEKHGTFTNTEGRVQRVYPAVPAPGLARPDWQILVDLSQYFDHPLDYSSPEDVWSDIRRQAPVYADVVYSQIGPRGSVGSGLVAVG